MIPLYASIVPFISVTLIQLISIICMMFPTKIKQQRNVIFAPLTWREVYIGILFGIALVHSFLYYVLWCFYFTTAFFVTQFQKKFPQRWYAWTETKWQVLIIQMLSCFYFYQTWAKWPISLQIHPSRSCLDFSPPLRSLMWFVCSNVSGIFSPPPPPPPSFVTFKELFALFLCLL